MATTQKLLSSLGILFLDLAEVAANERQPTLANAIIAAVTGVSKGLDVASNAAPTEEPPASTVESAAPVSAFETVMNLLSDERFNSRKLATLAAKSGLSEDAVLEMLMDKDVDYEVLTKRSTEETLIALV